MVEVNQLEKIEALLRKAESTEFPEEAQAWTAKAEALMTKWEGANKNDIVVVAGIPDGTTTSGPAWESVHA